MAEVSHSPFSSSETEKGVQTPSEVTGAIRLSADDTEQQLPPIDRGKDAWLFLAACFVMEALVWGFAFTYGVFQAYYSKRPEFKNSSNLAVIGTCAMVRI
jgi:hypothetical protein